jgi:hypothetical protein
MSTGTVSVTSNVAAELRSAPWRKAALTRDFGSVISIPLRHNELSYGVLTVFASEPDAFDASVAEMSAELGETIANAMNSVETRQALLTDTVVELELDIHEPDDFLGRLARETACEVEYRGAIPQSDGNTRLFFTTSGAPASAIYAAAEDVPSIQRLDHIGDDQGDTEAGENRFEMTVSGPTIPSTLVECGAVARSLEATESGNMDIVVVNMEASEPFQRMLEDLFGEQDIGVATLELADADATDQVVLTEDDEVLATSPLSELSESILLVNADIYTTGARSLDDADLPDVLAELDERGELAETLDADPAEIETDGGDAANGPDAPF